MEFFTNKKIWSKIIIVLIFLLLFQFIVTKPSLGADADPLEFGGKLLSPILSLVVTLGDAVMKLAHSSIMGVDESLLEANLGSNWWEILGKIVIWVLAAAIAVAIVCIGGTLVAALVTAVVIGVVGTGYFEAALDQSGASRIQTASYVQENLPNTLYLPAFTLSPEEIFQGKVLLFDVDFFGDGKEIKVATKPRKNSDGEFVDEHNEPVSSESDAVQDVDYYYYLDNNGEEVKTSKQDMAQELKGVISKWYVTLRNIALVGMMIVLLYVGIRMLISTVASDKAKYKTMIQDWIIGIILLAFLHYIMAFSVTIVKKIVDIIASSVDKAAYVSIIPDDVDHKFADFVKEAGLQDYWMDSDGNPDTSVSNDGYLAYPSNLLGYARIRAELANWGGEYIGWAMSYLVLVLFTAFFIVSYLKRVLYMAFLTIIAPLVALTYPIDKLSDGSAQGFNKWLKEYIFNLLIQPVHLLLYYILVTSAFSLASTNVIYTLVAIGFMMPAEKILRNLFGFEKASTSNALSAAAGGALAMTALKGLSNLGGGKAKKALGAGGKSKGGSSNSGDGEEDKDVRVPRTLQDDSTDETQDMAEHTMLGLGEQENDEDQDALDQMRIEADDNEDTTDEEREYIEQEQARLIAERQQRERNAQLELERDRANTARFAPQKPKGFKQRAKKAGRRALRLGHAAGGYMKTAALNSLRHAPEVPLRMLDATAKIGGGILGVAQTIATGESEQLITNTLAGSAMGGALSNRFTANGEQKLSELAERNRKDPKAEFNRIRESRKYEDLYAEDYIDKQKKGYNKTLEANFDKEKVKQMQKDGTIDRYIQNGVTNVDDIIAAERMREEDRSLTQKNAIAIAKYSKRVGKDYNSNKAKEWQNTFAEEYRDKSKMNQEQSDKVAKETMKKIAKFNKIKKTNYR